MRLFAWFAVLVLAGGVCADPGSLPEAASGFTVTKEPVYDGTRATADLPASQHHRNIGGSDGAGLCVFTSIWHAAIWQNVTELDGYRAWVAKMPGGGWPDKVDSTLRDYCKAKKIPVPGYVQHEGGDADFLTLALKTGRMVAVTYCGADGTFYNEVVAHMVNLVYLDRDRACILDNNNPGKFLWMSRAAFLGRWKGLQANGKPYLVWTGRGWQSIGGGWAVVLLAPPPPPYPALTREARAACAGCADCQCGSNCHCADGGANCPRVCPAAPVAAPRIAFGQCPGGRCPAPFAPFPANPFPVYPSPIPVTPEPLRIPEPAEPLNDETNIGKWVLHVNGTEAGFYVYETCVARAYADGRCESVDGNGNATGIPTPPPSPPPFGVPVQASPYPLRGVDPSKLHGRDVYQINGVDVRRDEALAALQKPGLTDDSTRWHLTVVGDADFVKWVRADLKDVPADVLGNVLVQVYAPDHWSVKAFSLSPGVNLRAPAAGRTAADVGTIHPDHYCSVALGDLLAKGPWKRPALPEPKTPDAEPVPPSPVPAPAPKMPNLEPVRVPVTPSPAPATPSPAPAPDAPAEPAPLSGGWLVSLLAAVTFFLHRLFTKG